MTDKNKNYTEVFEPQTSALAREHAKRAARRVKHRNKRVSKFTRYAVSVILILLVFFLAFMIGSSIIKLLFSSKSETTEVTEDSTSVLQMRLEELSAKCSEYEEDIKELQSQLDKYNELYGPLDTSSEGVSEDSESSAAFQENTSTTSVEEL